VLLVVVFLEEVDDEIFRKRQGATLIQDTPAVGPAAPAPPTPVMQGPVVMVTTSE
ncbi:hypothetical protein CCACVL1_21437, partial [Corchorus capsularis]